MKKSIMLFAALLIIGIAAIVIAGGLIFAGILILSIIPAVYSHLSSNNRTVGGVLETIHTTEDSLTKQN